MCIRRSQCVRVYRDLGYVPDTMYAYYITLFAVDSESGYNVLMINEEIQINLTNAMLSLKQTPSYVHLQIYLSK